MTTVDRDALHKLINGLPDEKVKVIAQCPDGLDPDISIEQEEAAAKMANTPPPLIPVYVPHIPAVADLPFEVFKQLRRDTSPKYEDF